MQKVVGGMAVMRYSLIKPWIAELDRRQIDSTSILEQVGLPIGRSISSKLFVPANSAYRFINLAARVADEPFLGAKLGLNLDLRALPLISDASELAATVGDLLIRIAINSEQHSTSVKMGLQIESEQSTFNVARLFQPDILPSQIDAYYVGVLVNALKSALPSKWNSRQVRVTVCDPDAIPPDLDRLTVLQGDGSMASVTFPSQWMFECVDTAARLDASGASHDMPAPPATLIDSLKNALGPHIHEADLTVERSAELCGFEKRNLARKLKSKGTTMAKLIASIRQERAQMELASTNRKIGEIAQSVGFNDPTVFSRAFKNWTGQSPQEYRKSSR